MSSQKCPSCDTPLELKTHTSTHLVCPSCQSVLAKAGNQLKATGEKATLQADQTILRLGTLINYQEQSFEVIGRFQFLHSSGLWNEWHLVDRQGDSWWIGERARQFFLFQEDSELLPPARKKFMLGESKILDQKKASLYQSALETVSGFEGELPFHLSLDHQQEHHLFRLESRAGFLLKINKNQREFHAVYKGQWLNLDELHLENPKKPSSDDSSHLDLGCQQCDAPILLYLGGASHTYYCPSCGIPHDTSSQEPKPLYKTPKADIPDTPISVGDRFTYQEISWRCVALFQKEALLQKSLAENAFSNPNSLKKDPEMFEEYLFFHPQKGYRTLISVQHQWTWFEPTVSNPEPHSMKVEAGDLKVSQLILSHPSSPSKFKYFFSEKITTKNALGELPLGSSISQVTERHNYINPPQMLCLEKDSEQLSWSVGTYFSHQELQEQFPEKSFPLPSEETPPSPCQPNPHVKSEKKPFYLFLCFLALFLLVTVYQIFSAEKVHQSEHPVPPLQAPTNQTQEFLFPKKGSMDLRFISSNIFYDYCSIKAILTHQETQKSYHIEPFIKTGYFNDFYLRGMPKGQYTLTWSTYCNDYEPIKPDHKVDLTQNTAQGTLNIEISRSSFTYLAFLLTLAFLSLFIFGLFYQSNQFEEARWDNKSLESRPIEYGTCLFLLFIIGAILLHVAFAYYFCPYGRFATRSSLAFLLLYPFFISSIYLSGYVLPTNLKTAPLLLSFLVLLAINSFFGYGCSSSHTKVKASDIRETLVAEPCYSPPKYPPGGGRFLYEW